MKRIFCIARDWLALCMVFVLLEGAIDGQLITRHEAIHMNNTSTNTYWSHHFDVYAQGDGTLELYHCPNAFESVEEPGEMLPGPGIVRIWEIGVESNYEFTGTEEFSGLGQGTETGIFSPLTDYRVHYLKEWPESYWFYLVLILDDGGVDTRMIEYSPPPVIPPPGGPPAGG